MSLRIRKADIILVVICLVIAGVLFLVFRGGSESGVSAVVRVDGAEVARYSLDRNGTYELNGGTNILVIKDGTACVSEADCPDKICVKQGRISMTGQCITCLPNHLMVTIEGGESDIDFYMS